MSTETLLIEIGTEELPPKALRKLGEAFCNGVTGGLAQNELAFGDVQWFATPRRLAVLIEQVQLQGEGKDVEILGPPADKAKDEDGNWTKAASGFARKQGVSPDELQTLDTPKGPRLGLRRTEEGAKTADCLNAIVQDSLQALPIPKRMRWGANKEEFVRPAHWVIIMLGKQADFGNILGIATGNTSRGHRFHSDGAIEISRAEDYVQLLTSARVIVSFEERRQRIREQVEAEAKALGAHAVIAEDLLDEVTGLVEWPVALTGSFEQRFLEVPQEALISSMKEHQKYFHVVDGEGKLMPHFITVSNIESTDPAQVIAGNERVIRPRLSDAAFFYETDCKTPLADRLPALESIVFQQKLGTLHDKSQRVAKLAAHLAGKIGAPAELAERAALLSKADLVTEMVLEFSDMQGIAGSYYAARDGEEADVASALAEQYWPKFAGDKLPQTATACALGLADRLDTLVGIFGIGQPPTGSKDPFALRRASLAILRILVEKDMDLDLKDCLESAVSNFPAGVIAEGTTEQVLGYMIDRLRAWYEDEKIPVEVFKAVAARNISQPLDFHQRVQAVHAFSQLPQAQALAAANKRVSNILEKLDAGHEFSEVSTDLLQEPAEKALSEHLAGLEAQAQAHLAKGSYTDALAILADLREPVDAFFDSVMVNAEDEKLRNNRLNLLKKLHDLFLEVADISQLVVGK
jgi:glycyl-tRNA synthetase beta chain